MSGFAYALASGPLVWAAFTFVGLGLGWRAGRFLLLARRRDKAVFQDFRWGFALASVVRYMLPLNRTARVHPLTTAVGYVFHLSFLALAFGASGHVVLWEANFGLAWPTLPAPWALALTLAALGGVGYFAGRRLLVPAWRGLSGKN